MNKIIDSVEIAKRIKDGDVIGLSTSGGGMGEPDMLLEALENRFLESGHPRDLTIIHSLGFGDGKNKGLNRFAHKGMLRRTIGAHFSWGPKLQEMIKENLVEAYCLPAGAIHGMLRETGAGRPGFITHVGIGTFADPRYGGGKANTISNEELVEIITIDGEEKLRYKPVPVDIALLKATCADSRGNISLEEEAIYLDAFSVALAAHNSGGNVYVQVRDLVSDFSMQPRAVQIPGIMVNGVVEQPDQSQTYLGGYDLSISGQERRSPSADQLQIPSHPVRRLIAARALQELQPEASVNFGFGIPIGIPDLASQQGTLEKLWISVEQGVHNGYMLGGPQFGCAYNAEAIITSTDQFDYYSGKGLDVSFLGMGEMDRNGNVNVSHLGGMLIGPGGFVDISQNSKKIVFCGTFDAKGNVIDISPDGVTVVTPGSVKKIVDRVEAITFNGEYAISQNQEVIYITERAVFSLSGEGVVLTEIAPGIEIERDILPYMAFRPIIQDPKRMDSSLFQSVRSPSA